MGVRIGSTFSTTFIGPFPANNTETIVLTTGPVNLAVDNANVLLVWFFSILAGTGVTQIITQIRRGTQVSSPRVGISSFPSPATAAVSTSYSGCYVDTPGVVAAVQYTATIVQTGATAASSWNDGCLMAFVL